MIIVQDNNEQTPLCFRSFTDVVVEVRSLETADYSLAGYESVVGIERKALGDLVKTLTKGRVTFEKELDRMIGMSARAILIEATVEQVRSPYEWSATNPESIWQTLISIQERYQMPIHFAATRADAAQYVYDFFRHFLRHRTKELAAMERHGRYT